MKFAPTGIDGQEKTALGRKKLYCLNSRTKLSLGTASRSLSRTSVGRIFAWARE
jgi:hypothetical protein